MVDQHHEAPGPDVAESPLSISRFFHVLRDYLPVIFLSIAAVMVAYVLLALLSYLLTPSQRITTQRFRLDFVGAASGRYPNGQKFAPSEVINGPILLRVYEANDLRRFVTLEDFSRSIFVLEANSSYESLASEYQARLADPKLTPVDRERIQREFELKRESLTKNEYSLNFAQTRTSADIPDRLIRKSLADILTQWANFAANEQHVLAYRVTVLSPSLLEPGALELNDPIIAVQVLRSKLSRVQENIDEIRQLPAAELARTQKDRQTLSDIAVRLDEMVRYRLEPLVPLIRSSGLVADPAGTIRFVEAQLAHDERRLRMARQRAETIRQSLAVYTEPRAGGVTPDGATDATPNTEGDAQQPRSAAGAQPVMQLSSSFMDRVLELAAGSADMEYRQRLVNSYQNASLGIIPAEEAVAYNQHLLEQLRGAPTSTVRIDAATARAQLDSARAEARDLVVKVNEIYRDVSRNLNPSTQLYAMSGPTTARVERAVSLSRIALWGIVVFLLALPAIILGCLVHARVRQEEALETQVAATHQHPARIETAV